MQHLAALTGTWVFAVLVVMLLMQPPSTVQAENASNAPSTEVAAPDADKPRWPMMDNAHDHISRRLLSSAEWFDAFFDDERYETEVNESRMRLSFESSAINGEGVNFDARTHLKIVLPELEERLSFEISGDTSPGIPSDRLSDGNLKKTDEDEEGGGFTAGFRYLLTTTDRLNIHLKSGARIRSFEPMVYIGPRYRQTFDYRPWALRFTQRVRWYSDEGWESISRLDLEREFFKDYFFRTSSEVKWYEMENGLFYDLAFSFSRAIDRRTAIELQWINQFRTRPHEHLSTTIVQLRYRRIIWRDWLSFEVAPQIAYPRERDYNFTPGILFKAHIVFGFYPKTGYY